MVDSPRRLALIVTLIDLARNDVASCSATAYHADRRLADATALRVMHIAENAIRLDPAIRLRHPRLPWREMAATRNVVAHDYASINDGLIRRAVIEYLDELRTMCRAELAAERSEGE